MDLSYSLASAKTSPKSGNLPQLKSKFLASFILDPVVMISSTKIIGLLISFKSLKFRGLFFLNSRVFPEYFTLFVALNAPYIGFKDSLFIE